MLVFQSLQPGGRDVVFECRARFLEHRSSARQLFSHFPIFFFGNNRAFCVAGALPFLIGCPFPESAWHRFAHGLLHFVMASGGSVCNGFVGRPTSSLAARRRLIYLIEGHYDDHSG